MYTRRHARTHTRARARPRAHKHTHTHSLTNTHTHTQTHARARTGVESAYFQQNMTQSLPTLIHDVTIDLSASLHRYSHMFHWMDGTVGYFQNPPVSDTPLCTRLELTSEANEQGVETIHSKLAVMSCEGRHIEVTGYVCEQRTRTTTTEQLEAPINLTDHRPSYNGSQYITCPMGHMTHQFLSCDSLSSCWAKDESSALSCDPSLNPRPPMFTCTSETEHVPYSLVCDYRPDCRDHSDEDFCVFPEYLCLAGSFRCGSKQVNDLCFRPKNLLCKSTPFI